MKTLITVACGVILAVSAAAQGRSDEAAVRRTVESFYAAFNSHQWEKAPEFATEDWNHINPFVGRTRGRVDTLADLTQVHGSFLKGVTDIVEGMDVRFATADVAVVTVISRVSPYTLPGGSPRVNERQIRTFVVVKRAGRWQIMHDQNTIIAP